MTERIGVLGAGSWGTALAILLTRNGHSVDLWEFRPDVAERIRQSRINTDVLPGVEIPPQVQITDNLRETVTDKDLLVLATPSHVVREVCGALQPVLPGPVPMVSVVKGIENNTLLRVTQIVKECLPDYTGETLAVLSGPSHAEEVAREVPTAVVAAAVGEKLGQHIQTVFMNGHFRVYQSNDPVGVELGGALKNVIAIASGICDGAEFGDNTKAALMTRGLAEMTRLGCALGAQPETFMGLAGIGDLIVTCMSRHSRNRHVGMEIGKGRPLEEVIGDMVMVAEGVKTTASACDLARREGVEVPITEKVNEVLFKGRDPREAVRDLMTRTPKQEHWDNKS